MVDDSQSVAILVFMHSIYQMVGRFPLAILMFFGIICLRMLTRDYNRKKNTVADVLNPLFFLRKTYIFYGFFVICWLNIGI